MDSLSVEQVNTWLDTFLKDITPQWNPEKIILFGSRVKGNHLIFSDVDLLVVSEEFQNLNFRERKIVLMQHWQGLVDLELICLTPAEFKVKKEQIGIIREIVKTGIEL